VSLLPQKLMHECWQSIANNVSTLTLLHTEVDADADANATSQDSFSTLLCESSVQGSTGCEGEEVQEEEGWESTGGS
jgi:hypothetical protein